MTTIKFFQHDRDCRKPVCGGGCQTVTQTILGNGLGDYYRHRERAADRVEAAGITQQTQFALYDDPAVQLSFVRRKDDATLEAVLLLDGIRCVACLWLNEQHLGRIPGVVSISVHYTTQRALIRWVDQVVHLSAILRAVADIGCRAYPFDAQVRERLAPRP